MNHYSVDQAFEVLKQYKLTSHPESVRRWLRNGTLKGTASKNRKKGWVISEEDLWHFIRDRTPDAIIQSDNVNGTDVVKDEEAIRAKMWWEIVRKNIFEDFIEIKKTDIKTCIEHNRQSKDFERYVWEHLSQNKGGYATPRVPYLHDACLYDGQRLKLDDQFADTKEQILFAVIEYLRKKRVEKQ